MEESLVEVPKVLGDVFEAVVCAVFLDCGMNLELVWKVILPMFMPFIGKSLVCLLGENKSKYNLVETPAKFVIAKISIRKLGSSSVLIHCNACEITSALLALMKIPAYGSKALR